MTNEAKFDPIGKARAQRRLLELIPEPDDAIRQAAHAALVHSGVSAETMAILEEASQAQRRRPASTAARPTRSPKNIP